MSFNLLWTEEALTSFEDRIAYLKQHWTEKEIRNFKSRVRNYLEILIESPFIGKKPGKLNDVYKGLVIKQVSLVYRVKADKRQSNYCRSLIIDKIPKRLKSILHKTSNHHAKIKFRFFSFHTIYNYPIRLR